MYQQKIVAKTLIWVYSTGPVFEKYVETARECSKTVENTATGQKCSFCCEVI